ncbi:MAG TPA: Fe-S cluster assembly protein SufD [Thermoanaerobaculia bacterium]|jgi:Fe-S cluster assembly protein SufD
MTVATNNDLRERAAERFTQLGWPTPRIEEWRYTNLANVAKTAWRTDDAPAVIETPATLAGRATVEYLFVNGHLVRTTGPALQQAEAERVGQLADFESHAMIALNAAQMQDGARIRVPDNLVSDGFIHLLFVGSGDGIWSHPRNVIDVGRNAQVRIVETFVGTGSYFTNAVTEIFAGEGSVVDHTKVTCEGEAATHVGSVHVRQERASSVTLRSISVGGALIRSDVYAALTGEGASVVLDGLFAGAGRQHIDNHTVIDHVSPHCDSLELYKGILDDEARGVFDGRIIVRPHASKTASKQSNHNLLLSGTAIVDSKPTLEIHNDDVKCNHGSTIGQLDEEALFYLRSRGIGEAEARNLLVYAFAGEIVDRIKVEPVREQIRRALFRAIPARMPERRENRR